jgi:hypothetical protein
VVGGILGLMGSRKTKAHLSSKHFRIPLGLLNNIVCSVLHNENSLFSSSSHHVLRKGKYLMSLFLKLKKDGIVTTTNLVTMVTVDKVSH